MSTRNATLAALLTDALDAAASEAAGKPALLATIAIEVLRPEGLGNVTASVTRKTRTLVFAEAELHAENGERLALATSVHKIPA